MPLNKFPHKYYLISEFGAGSFEKIPSNLLIILTGYYRYAILKMLQKSLLGGTNERKDFCCSG